MTSIPLLVGLLVLAYLGSFLVGGRTVRGVGLPSGLEYIALGFVLGPQALDIIGGDTLEAFEPVVLVALGWLAFGIGLDFGFVGGKRVRLGSLALGAFGALVTGAAVAAATWFTLLRLHVGATTNERLLLAGGIGVACSETTRHAVRWVIERHNARGPLADRLDETAHADDFFPLVAVAVLFALEPTRSIFFVKMPLRDWPLATVGLGLLLGAGATLLVRAELRLEDTWGILFGVTLIGIGATSRLGLSTMTASFFMGIAVSLLSRHRRELRAMVGPTEHPVLLPALLLAGARIDFRASPALPWIAAAAIGARMVAKIVVGWTLAVSPSGRRAGPLVGLSLLSSGALAVSVGLVFALRFPGPVGDTVLAVAVMSVTVGEFIGPVRLRAALRAAGEIEEPRSAPAPERMVA